MKKITCLLLGLIFLISFVSALKIFPTQERLAMNQYETKCTNVWILPQENFIISSKWAENGQGDISKYILTSEEINLGVESEYLSEGKYKFCFTPNEAGNFSGIIYFYSEKTMVEIGSWIDLEVKELYPLEKVSLLTGRAVQEIRENNYDLWFIFVSLVVIFVFLIFSLLRKNLT